MPGGVEADGDVGGLAALDVVVADVEWPETILGWD